MYYCCGITEKGVMPHNEDALLVCGEVLTDGSIGHNIGAPFITAVSDGVSGENSGEVASKMCLEQVAKLKVYDGDSLQPAIMDIHRKIADYSRNNSESRNMQATLCGIAVDENGAVTAFNVGDSRLYRFRNGCVRQLTRDQSLVQLLIDEGTITHEERRTHVHRNIIFPALGNVKDDPVIDILTLEDMDYGDVLLLCTDGLSDNLSTLDIQEIMELPKALDKRLAMLVRKALDRGCRDNISAAAVIFEGNI